MADPLAELAPLAYGFVLVLARVGCAVMLLPVLGETELPAMLRAGFALLLVGLLLPGLIGVLPQAPDSSLRALAQIAAEIVTGLWLGWLARLVGMALITAGQVISLVTGLSNVLQQDPALGTSNAALARLMTVAAPVILLASGLAIWPLAALAGSYDVIRAGHVLPAAATLREILAACADSFALALRLAAPFLGASLLWHLAVALASRLAAAVQPGQLAQPLQLLGGLLMLALLPAAILAAWRDQAGAVLAALPGLR